MAPPFPRALLEREQHRYIDDHPGCVRRQGAARAHWLNGVPMHWMTDWELPVPLIVREAGHGPRLVSR